MLIDAGLVRISVGNSTDQCRMMRIDADLVLLMGAAGGSARTSSNTLPGNMKINIKGVSSLMGTAGGSARTMSNIFYWELLF